MIKKLINNPINKIISFLDKVDSNYSKAKDKLSNWTEELGFQVELTRSQKKLWEDLKQVNVPQSVTTTGSIISQELVIQSDRMLRSILNTKLFISTASTASESLAGTVATGTMLSYPQHTYPKSYYQMIKVIEQKNDNEEISNKLRLIDDSLANEYENAWKSLHTTSKDETRSPMFLMREVINRLYHYYAPDNEVIKFHNIINNEIITRAQRLSLIASKIDQLKKDIFLKEGDAFENIYGELSYAHKHGKLDSEKSRGLLYQANALIKLLLSSFPK
jgi:hypothetical protein